MPPPLGDTPPTLSNNVTLQPTLASPAGVGKTLVAKAIAGEAKVPFYQMAGRCARVASHGAFIAVSCECGQLR